MWNILAVDDNKENLEVLLNMLEGIAKSNTACNGKEAVSLFKKSIKTNQPYDCILLDIAMPEINGVNVLKIIRLQEKKMGIMLGEGIKIIMVTSYKDPVREAYRHGCDDYIVKPIRLNNLIEKLEKILNKGN